MKCFIFHRNAAAFPDVCGSNPLTDLIFHLKSSGADEIFCDSEEIHEGVVSCDFESARTKLGSEWLAAYSGSLTRQSPVQLRSISEKMGADIAVSLACSSKPWEQTTILTDYDGLIEKIESNPPPENAETNLCFSGLVWVRKEDFNPLYPLHGKVHAFLLPGYWRSPDSRENYLLAVHDVLCRKVLPWPHLSIPDQGIIVNSAIPESTDIRGILWVGKGCRIGSGCILENCVILDNSTVGENSNLRNCLVLAGNRISRNTVQHDKYLSFLGDDNGYKD